MSDAVVNKGVQVLVGFDGIVSAHFIMDDSSEKPLAKTTWIKDDRNNRASLLVSNVARTYTLNGTIKDDVSHTVLPAVRALVKGSLISITPTGGTAKKCTLMSADLKFTRTEAKGSITVKYIPNIDPT